MGDGDWIYTAKSPSYEPFARQEIRDMVPKYEKAVSDYEMAVDSEFRRIATPAAAPAPSASEGIPTWGYVVGGLAAAGIIGWLVFKD